MRNIKFLTYAVMMVLVLLCINPILAEAERATFQFQETDLYPGGSAAGLHIGLDGNLFIVDRDDELWMVNPETGDYQDYYGFSGVDLMDIVQTDTNTIWWTLSDTVFGNLNLATNTVESWDLETVYEDLINLNAIVYVNDLIWLAPYYGPNHGLLSFEASTRNLCLYESPMFASDLILHDGLLWVINWNEDSLMSMDPSSGRLIQYHDSGWDIHTYDANLQSDDNLLWWTEDDVNGNILSFDPDTSIATSYELPVGGQPRNLTYLNEEVWYTNANGSIGRISPDFEDKTTKTLNEVVIQETITPVCVPLGAPETIESEPDAGTFDWNEVEGTIAMPSTGLQAYSLPDGAEPFGIASTSDEIWVSDPGRQKLIRMPVTEQETLITVKKVVINDDGGSAMPDDFNLTLEGDPVQSGVAIPVEPGTYTAAETLLPDYTFIGFSGDCDSNGDITVALGENKICTLTNDDQKKDKDYRVFLPIIIH